MGCTQMTPKSKIKVFGMQKKENNGAGMRNYSPTE